MTERASVARIRPALASILLVLFLAGCTQSIDAGDEPPDPAPIAAEPTPEPAQEPEILGPGPCDALNFTGTVDWQASDRNGNHTFNVTLSNEADEDVHVLALIQWRSVGYGVRDGQGNYVRPVRGTAPGMTAPTDASLQVLGPGGQIDARFTYRDDYRLDPSEEYDLHVLYHAGDHSTISKPYCRGSWSWSEPIPA